MTHFFEVFVEYFCCLTNTLSVIDKGVYRRSCLDLWRCI